MSHADTIRDYITNTERYDGRWHRLPTEQEVLAALDALLAENQRYEKALERIAHPSTYDTHGLGPKIAREALAGDAE